MAEADHERRERVEKFEVFLRQQQQQRPDLEAINLIVQDQALAEAFAADLRARGWRASASRGLTWSDEKNLMELRELVVVELQEGGAGDDN